MKALLIVDIQNDFMPWGALPVPHADEVIPIINALIPQFSLVVATQDWHPIDHLSFAVNHGKKVGEVVLVRGIEQILWPVHCVQHTPGAEFVEGLHTEAFAKIFHKGTDKYIDSYSAFYDNAHLKSTGLPEYLEKKEVDELFIVGVATDYCIKYSVLDALKRKIKINVVLDGCCGIDLHPGDIAAAIKEMKAMGAQFLG